MKYGSTSRLVLATLAVSLSLTFGTALAQNDQAVQNSYQKAGQKAEASGDLRDAENFYLAQARHAITGIKSRENALKQLTHSLKALGQIYRKRGDEVKATELIRLAMAIELEKK